MMIIGLTGKNAAGKGEVGELLQEKGFYFYSLSDVLREALKSRGEEPIRENLIRIGTELRRENGDGYLAETILSKTQPDRNYVIDSFRHPAEIEVFRRDSRYRLLLIEADPKIRFERIRQRGREEDPSTLSEFIKLEEREDASLDKGGQQLQLSASQADATVQNNASLEDLKSSVLNIVSRWSQQVCRPNWDEYFLGIAKVVSLRSNCVKRKVAAVIVKDKRVISTGYNGTPRGTTNCFEGGCPRCNNLTDSGVKLDECLCSHAEENAITQAAYHGVSVKTGTLYTTLAPCLMCTKMIINAGIEEVVYNLDYPLNSVSFQLFEQARIRVRQCPIG